MKKIALGSDHGGFYLKELLKQRLEKEGYAVQDFGCATPEPAEYPEVAFALAGAVAAEPEGYLCGILCCGTGIGMSIAANKVKGIRAALCHDTFSAQATREHNDANILALGARVVGSGLALKIVDTFLNTEFSDDERHKDRIRQIEE